MHVSAALQGHESIGSLEEALTTVGKLFQEVTNPGLKKETGFQEPLKGEGLEVCGGGLPGPT